MLLTKNIKIMSKVIFSEADRHRTARYKVKGCEKALVVRSDVSPFTLEIETMSLEDSHFRPQNLMTITMPGDYDLRGFNIGCGMELVFRIVDPIAQNAHLFAEIIYETCIPEKCCKC